MCPTLDRGWGITKMNQKAVLDKDDNPREERRQRLKHLLTGGRKAFMHLAFTNRAPTTRHTQMDKASFLPSRNPVLCCKNSTDQVPRKLRERKGKF